MKPSPNDCPEAGNATAALDPFEALSCTPLALALEGEMSDVALTQMESAIDREAQRHDELREQLGDALSPGRSWRLLDERAERLICDLRHCASLTEPAAIARRFLAHWGTSPLRPKSKGFATGLMQCFAPCATAVTRGGAA
jgi:hypothetical protein